MPSDRLCKSCEALDLYKHATKSMDQPWKVWRILSSSAPCENLSRWRDIQKKPWCPFCRLVVQCVRSATAASAGGRPQPGDMMQLSNRPSWKMCISIFNFNGASSKVYSNKADLQEEAKAVRKRRGGRETQRLLVSWPGCKALGQIQRVADSSTRPEGKTFLGRVIKAEKPDWSLLRWWLRHCNRCHGDLCEAAAKSMRGELPANMRVIDVQERTIVRYHSGWDYIALTYVWGQHLIDRPMATLDRERADTLATARGIPLPAWIPKTVSDTIDAVGLLGYRYLWVDALCIIQDDPGDRDRQILRMDAIYRNASLTIAAGSGSHADYGLPGMSLPRKFKQQRETLQDITLAVPLPRFDELNTGSLLTWNTRAWTFQEKALSRRLLIFTDYQVFFRCSNGVWSEDTASETTCPAELDGSAFFRWGDDALPTDYFPHPYSLVDFLGFGSLELSRVEDHGSFTNYAAVVEEFTQRTLTFQEDALPAISGVLRVLDSSRSAYVAGLPRRYFSEAMLWYPKLGGKCTEMAGASAPSWSWARWSLPLGCSWAPRDVKDTAGIGNGAMCYWTGDSGPLPISSRRQDLSDIPGPDERPSLRRALKSSGFVLGWRAEVAHFTIGLQVDGGSSVASDDTVAAFQLLHDDLGVIGEVITTHGMTKKYDEFTCFDLSSGTELRFVSGSIPWSLRPKTISEVWVPGPQYINSDGTSTEKPGHYETRTTVHETSTWKVVNVMMIEEIDGIAYRRGIGKVILGAWYKVKTPPASPRGIAKLLPGAWSKAKRSLSEFVYVA